MSLTLAIRNVDRLDNGAPRELVLNRRGAMIGRSATCDWSLPDPRNYISSRHCEVSFRDGFYYLADVSTNGTFLNGGGERMAAPRRIAEGDCFLIGHYQVTAHLSGEAVAALEREQQQAQEANQASEWGGWDAHGGASRGDPAETAWSEPARGGGGLGSHAAPLAPGAGWGSPQASAGWDALPAAPASSGWGPAPTPATDGWSAPPAEAVSSASGWAPRLGTPLAPEAEHLAQGRLAAGGAAASAFPPPPAAPGGWAAPTSPAPPAPGPSTWEQPDPQAPSASGWSSAAPDLPPPPSPDDVWGRLAAGNVVDWANSGFGQPLEEKRDPLGLSKPTAAPSPLAAPPPPGPEGDGWGAPPAAAVQPAAAPGISPLTPAADPGWGSNPLAKRPSPGTPPAEQTAPPPAGTNTADVADRMVEAFATAAGLKPGQLKTPSSATLDRAGQVMRRLVGGLVVMMEARARAKSQMGAEATSLSFDGNNPIKFARTAEQAVAQLLNPVERGFMDADKAIDDAFFDLQSHQMATLKAMQGALRTTLDRFSPNAIRGRAEQRGLFARILPGAREAALWQAYEREFSGVARGSDEAFMDVFAKEFRKAYDEQSRGRKR